MHLAPASAAAPAHGGRPGAVFTDARGCVRRRPAEPALRRAVNAHEAAMRFAEWLRDWGFTGWHTTEDVCEFFEVFCAEAGLEPMNPDTLRERFAAVPGVTSERKRLLGAQWAPLRRYLTRLKRPSERAHLYRIASHEEMAAAAAAGRPGKTSRAGTGSPQSRSAQARRAA